MSDAKLFTAIYIPKTLFANGVLKPQKTKKYNFELLENEKIADTLYHFIYKKDEKQIHSFYYIGDLEDVWENICLWKTMIYMTTLFRSFWAVDKGMGKFIWTPI